MRASIKNLLLLAILFNLISCGGGGETDSTSTPSINYLDDNSKNEESQQQKRGLGALIPTEEMLASIPVALPPVSSYSANDLDPSFDLSDKMPPVRSQGGQGSCASWAVGYYLKGYHEHIDKDTDYGKGSDYSGAYSPAFLYNVLKLDSSCDGGTYISQNLDRVKDIGIASWKDMPYKDSECSAKPSPKVKNSAKCARILDYQRIRTHDPLEKIEMQDMKYYLSHGNPIVIGIRVYDGFSSPKRVDGEFFYKEYNENGGGGGHAIVVVGYDDSKNAFKIINSWGTDWGNDGFLWIDYDVFKEIVFVAYRTTDADEGCEESSINVAPVADAEVEVGESVKFDASKSYDSDGSIVSYKWFLGNTLLSSSKTFTKDDFDAGQYSITLKVTDNEGASSTKTITVNIKQSDNNFDKDYFITTWKTDNQGTSDNNQITIPTNSYYKYNYSIDWGDGKITNGVTGDITHTYSKRGKYTIKIWGEFPSIYLGKNADYNITTVNSDARKLLSVEQWGNIKWESMYGAFEECNSMTLNAKDNPDLSNVTDIRRMFAYSTKFNQSLNSWNVFNIKYMNSVFAHATKFNQPLNNWNISNVISMDLIFFKASSFNQPLNNWDTSNVKYMYAMFSEASNFNQPLNNWDTSNVTHMSHMFHKASNFNQPLNNWDISNVKYMYAIFGEASSFNQSLNNWDTSNVIDMGAMFYNTKNFSNQNLSSWNVSNVTNHDNFSNGWGSGNIEPNWEEHGNVQVNWE